MIKLSTNKTALNANKLNIISSDVELSESISGNSPPIEPKNHNQSALFRSICSAVNKADEASPVVMIAVLR